LELQQFSGLTSAANALLFQACVQLLTTAAAFVGPLCCCLALQHIEHVLPMIPGGASFKDIITEGDGSREY
jgi:hypothetical protein